MKKNLIIEQEAERDLGEAYDWYEAQRPGLGEDFFLCVEVAFEIIRERPRSFPKIHRNARRTLVHRFPYLILFAEHRDLITIHGVFHTSRDPQMWKDRLR